MKTSSILKKISVTILCVSLFGITMLPAIGNARNAVPQQVVNPVSFASKKNVEIYKSDVSGSSYGWKVILFIRISRPDYNEAVNNLWKNAGIPSAERDKYQLVNIREQTGTDWGVIVCGQNYLTVTADIAEDH